MINVYSSSLEETFADKPKRGFLHYVLWTLQTVVIITFLGGMLAFADYLYKDYNDYIDLAYHCDIDINKDILHGNKETIVKAMELIKNDDSEVYLKICRNVERIAESRCFRAEPLTNKIHEIPTPGCYIKGSRTIFIRPDTQDTDEIVQRRKDTILKYSEELINYWETYDTSIL